MPIDYSAQTTLITGASSGLGAEFARQLAARGSDLVLVARRRDRLDALAAELVARYSIVAHVIPLDLSAPAPGETLAAEITARGIAVTSLVNNAGFGTQGDVHETAPGLLRDEIAVNVTALVDITRAFIEPLRSNGTGMIINISSVGAYTPSPGMAVYAASKAFVLSFTEALWVESRASGLRVLALLPGATSTEFFEVLGSEGSPGGTTMQTPHEVVATALRTLDRRRSTPGVIAGIPNRLSVWALRLLTRRRVVLMVGALLKR